MKRFIDNLYSINIFTIKHLKSLGFYYNKEFSDKHNKYYSIRFPAMKYNEYVSIEGEFTVDISNGNVYINVYDLKGNRYAPFYNNEYGNYNDVLSIIYKSINKQMRKYKIKKIGIKTI